MLFVSFNVIINLYVDHMHPSLFVYFFYIFLFTLTVCMYVYTYVHMHYASDQISVVGVSAREYTVKLQADHLPQKNIGTPHTTSTGLSYATYNINYSSIQTYMHV